MGEVLLAHDTKLDRRTALKLLRAELAHDPQRRQRFITEAKAASALNHPNICTVYEVGEAEDHTPYIAMEYLEGQTLDQKLAQGSVDALTITDIGLQVADALDTAHAKGIVHRDIKPSNISVNDRGRVKVLDFGIAKRTAAAPVTDETATTQYQTQDGSVLGTPNYMSPEQALGKPIDQRTDIFSLGIVLYHLATGRLPFSGANPTETVEKIIHAQPEAIARLNYELPAELERIIQKCLEKDREDRYQAAKDLMIDLRRLKRTGDTQTANPPVSDARGQRKNGRRLLAAVATAVVLVVTGYFLWPRAGDGAGRSPHDKFRLAVLPLENISRDPTDEFFVDGLTEELISRLSKLHRLTVIARTSVMNYKDSDRDLAGVANELRVGTVLEGSVRRAGGRLRISMKLVDVATQGPLWSQEYDRELKDIFAIQTEVAQHVATALNIEFQVADRRRLAEHSTQNLQAYELYMRGVHFFNKRTAADINRAIDLFKEAVSIDGDYALAYAGLGASYSVLPFYAGLSSKELLQQAEEAAAKALELDETVAEAHAVRGAVEHLYHWDWKRAEVEYQRALELNPSYATARMWYCNLLMGSGRLHEALAQIERAQEADPLSLVVAADVGVALIMLGRYEEGVDQLRKAIERNPRFPMTHFHLAWAYGLMGRHDKAVEEALEVRAIVGRNSHFGLAHLGHAYARAGRRSEALATLTELETLGQGSSLSYDMAIVHLGLGDRDSFFKLMQQALDNRTFQSLLLGVDPQFKDLRTDPRYLELLKRIGLDEVKSESE
jgi:serine/threonine protein kinase/Flp pilus assembly protein TadD